ncbi:MAG: hypothetical protein MPK62_00325 [Alphaproteobacteria bacterium]|nr:hypothetical protein [Alphaproteobacteria bacterium]MDA8029583.1 hypothetical protein [Alphaproteobacteria bacterium]
MMEQQATYKAIIGRDREGYYGIISNLPSCFVDGGNIPEVVRNLKDVARMSKRTLHKFGFGSYVSRDQIGTGGIGTRFDENYFHDNGIQIVGTRTITV